MDRQLDRPESPEICLECRESLTWCCCEDPRPESEYDTREDDEFELSRDHLLKD